MTVSVPNLLGFLSIVRPPSRTSTACVLVVSSGTVLLVRKLLLSLSLAHIRLAIIPLNTLQLSLRTHTYTLFPSHAQQGNVDTHVHTEWHLHTCICKHFYWVFKSGDTGTSSRICTLASTSRKDAGRRYLSGTFSSPLFFLMASAKFLRAVWHLSGQMVSIGQATTVDVQSFATDISNVSATVRLLIPIPATAASRLSKQLPGRTCATILPILLPKHTFLPSWSFFRMLSTHPSGLRACVCTNIRVCVHIHAYVYIYLYVSVYAETCIRATCRNRMQVMQVPCTSSYWDSI